MNECECVCFGFVFCVNLVFQTKVKKATKHKPKLREEIKSSFFARISQLISNSTTKHTHTPNRSPWFSDAYVCFRNVWFNAGMF